MGIISREIWDSVQARFELEKARRLNGIIKRCASHFLYGTVFCGGCGAPYIRKTVRSDGGAYQKIWKCKGRLEGRCGETILTEEGLLHSISDNLGWEWRGVDGFDSARFTATVERVELYGDRVWVVKKAAA